jgi:hypothetical protein
MELSSGSPGRLAAKQKEGNQVEHATAHRSKEAKRVWKQHRADKCAQDAAAGRKLAELERQYPEPVISLELAKAKTRLAQLSVQ